MPTTNTVTTREQYNDLFPTLAEAVAFEESCLRVGKEFLPAQAILVHAGAEPGPAYWAWLAEALEVSEREAGESERA